MLCCIYYTRCAMYAVHVMLYNVDEIDARCDTVKRVEEFIVYYGM